MKLYIHSKETRSGGDDFDPSDPQACRGTTTIELEVRTVSFDRGTGFWPATAIEVDPSLSDAKELILTVVRYRDGDTYHNVEGCYQWGTAFATLEEAQAWDPDADKTRHRPWMDYFCGEHWGSIEYWRVYPGGADYSADHIFTRDYTD